MELKLIKNELELKNFVNKYKELIDFVYCIEAFSFENDKMGLMNRENLCNFFEIFYKKFKMERFIKDYVLLLVEKPNLTYKSNFKQQSKFLGDFFIEFNYYEKENNIFIKKNPYYADESKPYLKDSLGFFLNRKEYLYDLLKSIEKYMPQGLLMDENTKTINEELFKQFVGIKSLSLGIEFEIQFIDDKNIERKYVCKLLDYKKEIRLYDYNFFVLFNKNIDNYNNLNKFEQKMFCNTDNWIWYHELQPENLVIFFFYRVYLLYNLYLNCLYNDDEKYKKLFTDLFDYNHIEKDLIIFLDGIKKRKNQIEKSLDITDLENFDKEYAHACYIEYFLENFAIPNGSYISYIEELDQMVVNSWENDRGEYYEGFFRSYCYDHFIKHDANIWVKGFGKYKEV